MRTYLLEVQCELLSLLRMPRFSLSVIGMPLMFFLFYGVTMRRHLAGDLNATYMLSTFGTFGVMAAAVWGITAGIANDRGSGWMHMKRASPMPPLAYFAAKLAGGLAFSAVSVALLFVLAAVFADVRLPAATWFLLGFTLLVSTIPFCALGFALGYVTRPGSAPALINMTIMPMAFLSGLWIPLTFLPPLIRRIADFLPAYHVSQLGLQVLGLPGYRPGAHVQILLALLMIFGGAGALMWRREENKVYG